MPKEERDKLHQIWMGLQSVIDQFPARTRNHISKTMRALDDRAHEIRRADIALAAREAICPTPTFEGERLNSTESHAFKLEYERAHPEQPGVSASPNV